MIQRYSKTLKDYIVTNVSQMTREPEGILKHPYVVPSCRSSPFYSKNLWDWDSWLVSVAMGQVEADTGEKGKYFEYESGCVKNFLEHMDPNGKMPIEVDGSGTMEYNRSELTDPYPQNMHKPVLAQHAALLVKRQKSVEWMKPYLKPLAAFLNRYLESYLNPETGLAYWKTDFAVGVDNDPSVYYRPDGSCGSIYLNCLLYRELLAYGYMLEETGDMDEANRWRKKAQDLAAAINRYCFDERDGTYYSVDFALRKIDPDDWLHKGAPRSWPCILLRIDNWSSFLPLWAGIASQEQAERMVERYRDSRTFYCNYGIRTLSRLEKMYDLSATNNPSNWLGPVWGISNYMMFRGLEKYGYQEDARDLAEKTVRLFGQDLEANGCLHEYYNPDTGEPIVTHGFQNWNFLVLNMIAWLEERAMVTEI